MYKTLFLILGFISIALAAIGAVLPLLPTTPFVLLSAFCFSKSSNRFHTWLLTSRLFGPFINDWNEHRGMRLKSKVLAIVSIIVVGGASVFFAIDKRVIQIIVAFILLIPLFIIIFRVRTL